MKTTAAILGIIAGIFALTWISQGNDFFLYKVLAPRQEAVRRQVFEQTRAFNQGMVQELENMRFKYVETTDKEARAALADVILHRSAGYNMDDPVVPSALRAFVRQLQDERTGTNKRSFE